MTPHRAVTILGVPLVARWNHSGGWHLHDERRRPYMLVCDARGWFLAPPLDSIAMPLPEPDLPALYRFISSMSS